MDEEKAKKFLSHADFARLDCITDTHRWSGGRVEDDNTFDGGNAKHRHKHRAELLGIVDRLLATTASIEHQKHIYNTALNGAEERIGDLQRQVESYKAMRDDATLARDKLSNQLKQYQSFGDLKPWFGGPYAALTLKPEVYDRVFGQHEGVAWSFRALSQFASRLAALADKPMAILDDAQGYYTVTDPCNGGPTTVKDLSERNLRQRDRIEETDQTVDYLKSENDAAHRVIKRKDAKLVEQQKRIDELEVQIRSVRSYSIAQNTISGLAGALRAAQEDCGDVMVVLMDAEERNDVLVRRLDKITELTDDITDVSEGEKDEELGPVGGIYGGPEVIIQGGPPDFSVTSNTYDPITGSIKRKD